jgi:hypothetical protein
MANAIRFGVYKASNGYILKTKEEGMTSAFKEPTQTVCKDKKELMTEIEKLIG